MKYIGSVLQPDTDLQSSHGFSHLSFSLEKGKAVLRRKRIIGEKHQEEVGLRELGERRASERGREGKRAAT